MSLAGLLAEDATCVALCSWRSSPSWGGPPGSPHDPGATLSITTVYWWVCRRGSTALEVPAWPPSG